MIVIMQRYNGEFCQFDTEELKYKLYGNANWKTYDSLEEFRATAECRGKFSISVNVEQPNKIQKVLDTLVIPHGWNVGVGTFAINMPQFITTATPTPNAEIVDTTTRFNRDDIPF